MEQAKTDIPKAEWPEAVQALSSLAANGGIANIDAYIIVKLNAAHTFVILPFTSSTVGVGLLNSNGKVMLHELIARGGQDLRNRLQAVGFF